MVNSKTVYCPPHNDGNTEELELRHCWSLILWGSCILWHTAGCPERWWGKRALWCCNIRQHRIVDVWLGLSHKIHEAAQVRYGPHLHLIIFPFQKIRQHWTVDVRSGMSWRFHAAAHGRDGPYRHPLIFPNPLICVKNEFLSIIMEKVRLTFPQFWRSTYSTYKTLI